MHLSAIRVLNRRHKFSVKRQSMHIDKTFWRPWLFLGKFNESIKFDLGLLQEFYIAIYVKVLLCFIILHNGSILCIDQLNFMKLAFDILCWPIGLHSSVISCGYKSCITIPLEFKTSREWNFKACNILHAVLKFIRENHCYKIFRQDVYTKFCSSYTI